MARNELAVAAAPETVFAVLADAARYDRFVVGAWRIRRFDPSWPAPGSVLHHTAGFPPLLIPNVTIVVERQAPTTLVLHARLLPVAVNVVRFSLTPTGDGTRVVIEEAPLSRPLARVWSKPLDGVLGLRNAALLRRLRAIAERREAQRRAWSAGGAAAPPA